MKLIGGRLSGRALIDSHRYYRTPTMRDREIVQPKILQSLGWNMATTSGAKLCYGGNTLCVTEGGAQTNCRTAWAAIWS